MKTHLVFLSLIIVISSCKKNPNEIFEKSIKKVSNIEIIEQRVAINYQDFLNHFWHTDTVNNYFIFRKDNIYGSRYHTDEKNRPIDFEMFINQKTLKTKLICLIFIGMVVDLV